MKKKIILIFLIFSITSLEVKAEGEADNWALFEEKSNEKTIPISIQIDLYIPEGSLTYETDTSGTHIDQIERCGTNDNFHVILDVPIILNYSYAIQNYYYNKVYAGGSFVYDYIINESIWWELNNDEVWSVYFSGDETCKKGIYPQVPIGDDNKKYIIKIKDGTTVYIGKENSVGKTWDTDLINDLVSEALIKEINKWEPKVSFLFPDSNDKKNGTYANGIGEMVSKNSTPEEWLAGENNSITRTFEYDIYDVYIDFRNNANIIYSAESADETVYVKVANANNLYFVPLNYPSEELRIEATFENFGLDDFGIDIEDVTTTAIVEVKQNLYDKNGSYKINYRPIDVSKLDVTTYTTYIDKIAKYNNWNDWLKQDGNEYVTENVNRIRDSYSGYPDGYDYNVSFSGKSDLNLTNTDWNYSDWTNINRNGSSNFLSNNSKIEQKINTTKNYCEIGEFSDGCNKRNN